MSFTQCPVRQQQPWVFRPQQPEWLFGMFAGWLCYLAEHKSFNGGAGNIPKPLCRPCAAPMPRRAHPRQLSVRCGSHDGQVAGPVVVGPATACNAELKGTGGPGTAQRRA